ncbi:MAG: FG-GAP-like repeat-containing protein [Isosphaeraceae bacterium]
MSDCTIVGNSARYSGGGIFNYFTDADFASHLDITRTTFDGNVSTEAWGGALSTYGTATLSDSSLINNEAFYGGGGIDNYIGSLVVSNTTIDGNRAMNSDGGGVHSYDATLEVHGSTISNNRSWGDGGGLSSYYEPILVSGTVIRDNISQSGYGGGMYSYVISDTVTIEGSEISGNTAYYSGGGVILGGDFGTTLVSNSTIADNTSQFGSGGGVVNYGYGRTTNITDSNITSNTAMDTGGGLAFNSGFGSVTILNSKIAGNAAGNRGGGLYSVSDTLTLAGAVVSANTAGDGGGGIHAYATTLHVADSAITDNLGDGIRTEYGSSGSTIGTPGTGNTITGNTGAGIAVLYGYAGNSIRGNAIHDNGGLAIDLGGDGRTANDLGDLDFGPNDLQNYPVIESLTTGATTHVTGRLSSTPNTTFTIDLYAQAGKAPVNPGSSLRYLGSVQVTTDGSGLATIDAALAAATSSGELVSATATSPDGSTSEFSDFPLVRVSPLDGLATTENGARSRFTVVLSVKPTASVIVPLSSSDPGEGTVAPASLTFTPANWNVPQVATITGVNDAVVDGPVAYSILTGPAISQDLRFNWFDADDVWATNYDNELPPAEAVRPLGSLIHGASIEGVIAEAGRVEGYSLRIDPGQTLSVLVEPAGGLRPVIRVLDQSGAVVDTATAISQGADALVQTIHVPGPIAGGGAPVTYRVEIAGNGGTTGLFTASLYLNAAVETEGHGGATNDTRTTAQKLDGAFVTLNTGGGSATQPDRVAVLGRISSVAGGRDDYYRFFVAPGQSVTVALASLSAGDADVTLLGPTGATLAIGNDADRIADFLATAGGIYSVKVDGDEGTSYGLVVTRNAALDSGRDRDLASAQPILGPEVAGRRWAIGELGGLDGESSPSDPVGLPLGLYDGSGFLWDIAGDGDIGDGTSDAYDGGLYHEGFPYFSSAAAEDGGREIVIGQATIGDVVVTRKIYVPADGTFARFLEIVTNAGAWPTDYTVRIRTNLGSDGNETFVRTSSGDGDFDAADDWIVTDDYDAAGDPTMLHVIAGEGGSRPSYAARFGDNLSYNYDLSLAPGETKIVMHFASQNASQADALARAPELAALGEETLAGMTGDELKLVVNFATLVATSDFYRITADGNRTIEIETSLPAALSGEFENGLDPMVRLYDAAGNLLASNDNGAADGRNARLSYKVPKDGGGTFTIEVLPSDATAEPTKGEYFLTVKGARAPQDPFLVEDTAPGDGFVSYTPPSSISIDFNDSVLVPTIQASDLTVDGVPVSGVTLVDGDTASFSTPYAYSFGGHYYLLTRTARNWADAEAEAVARGGHLVTVNDAAEQAFLKRVFASAANRSTVFWTGLNDVAEEGSFVWASGEPVTYTNWGPDQPDNYEGIEDGVGLNWFWSIEDGQWADLPHAWEYQGIIELTALPPGTWIASEGTHTIGLASGSVQDIQGTGLTAYNGMITLDYTPPRVVSTSIADGAVVPVGDVVYTVTFSEPLQTSLVDPWDIALHGSISGSYRNPSSVSFDATGTVMTMTFTDLADDTYTLTLFANSLSFVDRVGLILDGDRQAVPGNGVEGGDFFVNFATDVGPQAFPVPLAPLGPEGSLIFQTPYDSTGAITFGADSDDFTIELEAGQVLTVLVQPGSTLQASIAVRDPSNVSIASATGSSAGGAVLLQTVPIGSAGTYTVTIGGSGSPGGYSVGLTLNAALEEEAHGGGANNRPDSAQSIEGSFIPLAGGADRGAVRGVSGDDDVYSFHLAAGQSLTAALAFDQPLATFYGPPTGYFADWPNSIALGDVDNDNHLDMVTASANYSSFAVRLGLGDGSFGDPTTFSDGNGDNVTQVVLGDVNDDGNLDLIAATLYGGDVNRSVTVWLGNGDGTFQSPVGYWAGIYNRSVAVGDVTGDGMPDIVTVNEAYSDNLYVLPGNGDGTFGAAVVYTVGANPWDVALADVDGGNGLDIVSANYSGAYNDGQSVTVLLNQGDGNFGAGIGYFAGYDNNAVALGDVNGDGAPDIVTTNEYSNTVAVLLNNGDGSGTFGAPSFYSVGGFYVRSVALEDVDGDGSDDIATASLYNPSFSAGGISVLVNQGGGTFGALQIVDSTSGVIDLAVGDLDGDGHPDVVTAGAYSGNVAVHLNLIAPTVLTLRAPDGSEWSFSTGTDDLDVLLSGFVASETGIYTILVSAPAIARSYSLVVTREVNGLAPKPPASPVETQRIASGSAATVPTAPESSSTPRALPSAAVDLILGAYPTDETEEHSPRPATARRKRLLAL